MIKTDLSLFNPDIICDSGQIFRMYRVDGSGSVFLIYSGDRRLKVERSGDDVFFCCSEEEYESYWRCYLDMDRDYDALAAKIDQKDGFLARACLAGKGLRILRQDLFEMIISFIISQQKQIPSIRKCVEALCERFGQKHAPDGADNAERTGKKDASEGAVGLENGCVGDCGKKEENAWYGFPSPHSIAAGGPEGLKGLSLGYRERYIYETSCLFLQIEDELWEAVDKKDFAVARNILLSLTGVGEKVADCILLFACGDLDSFPVDTHIISIMDREYGEKTDGRLSPARARERVREVFGKYKGFSGLVQQWIFAYEISGQNKRKD